MLKPEVQRLHEDIRTALKAHTPISVPEHEAWERNGKPLTELTISDRGEPVNHKFEPDRAGEFMRVVKLDHQNPAHLREFLQHVKDGMSAQPISPKRNGEVGLHWVSSPAFNELLARHKLKPEKRLWPGY